MIRKLGLGDVKWEKGIGSEERGIRDERSARTGSEELETWSGRGYGKWNGEQDDKEGRKEREQE